MEQKNRVRNCVIRVDGSTYPELYDDLIELEVCERVGEPSSFALKLAIYKVPQGGWTRLNETQAAKGGFTPWQRITVAVSFDDSPDVLIDGYVAGVAPRFEPSEGDSFVLVWGYDATYAMDLDETIKAWPDKKYSEIATEIFESYGLSIGEVKDTQVVQDKDKELLIQRGTDWQFLKHLARRAGFDVFVRGGDAYFRPPELTRGAQKDLSVHFGDELTNVIWFEPRVVGDLPSKISMRRANPVTKKIEITDVDASPLRQLGKRQGDALRSGRHVTESPLSVAPPEPVVSDQAMDALVTGIRNRNGWILTGEGELDGMLYGRALRADGLVLIKGAGTMYSGRYYVTEVTHRITTTGYTQHFKVVRNALDLEGDEPFQSVTADPTQLAGNDERVQVEAGGQEVAS